MRQRDIAAALALACLGLVLYLGLARPEFLRRLHGTLQDEAETETLLVEILPSMSLVLKAVKAGDFQTIPSGRQRIELLEVRRRATPEILLSRGTLPEEVPVVLFRVTTKRRPDGSLHFAGFLLKPGSTLRFDPPAYTLSGIILSVEPERGH